MRHKGMSAAVVGLAMIASAPGLARATDGHFLHGVGAVNSAVAGVGVASATSVLGAFYTNPAGLLQFTGTSTEISFEMLKPERTVESTYGPMQGSTASSSEFSPVPAFGWSRTLDNGRLALGVAGLGIGGFGVDYHTDVTNPILMAPPNGFGQVYSNFQLMKIAPAVAWRVGSKLRVGVAANLDWSSLAIAPMPIGAPAVDPGPDGVYGTADDRAYYSSASDADGAFGIGMQAGLQYTLTSTVDVGLAYTSPQVFQKYHFGTVYANPNLPSYNTPRTIDFAMDVPAIYAAGLAVRPDPRLYLAADGKYITYASTRGFKGSGFNSDGSVRGFGWKDIWSFGVGAQVTPEPQYAIRLGYNYSGNPIPPHLSMFNTPAPAVVQHHATVGVGYVFANGIGVDAGYYRAFANSITGPIQTPAGALPQTSVKSTMSENSILLGFTYAPARARQ